MTKITGRLKQDGLTILSVDGQPMGTWGFRRKKVLRIFILVVKGDWNGAVFRNNRKKGWPVSMLGRARKRTDTKCLRRCRPIFFSPPAHLCAVTYITEISFNVSQLQMAKDISEWRYKNIEIFICTDVNNFLKRIYIDDSVLKYFE